MQRFLKVSFFAIFQGFKVLIFSIFTKCFFPKSSMVTKALHTVYICSILLTLDFIYQNSKGLHFFGQVPLTSNLFRRFLDDMLYLSVHEITAGHRSLSGTISCVTDRIRFLPVTMTGRFSNFNSIS